MIPRLTARSAVALLSVFIVMMLAIASMSYTPTPHAARIERNAAVESALQSHQLENNADHTQLPQQQRCQGDSVALKLLARVVAMNEADASGVAELQRDVATLLREHNLMDAHLDASDLTLFQRLSAAARLPQQQQKMDELHSSSSALNECNARVGVLSRSLADKDRRMGDLSKQLEVAGAKLQGAAASAGADVAKLRTELEARDEQLAKVKSEFADVQHRLDVRLVNARKSAAAAKVDADELVEALAAQKESLANCRKNQADLVQRKDEYKTLLHEHERDAGKKPGRATTTFRAATAEWHRTSQILPDSLDVAFQKRAYELNHPLLCDAEHVRFVVVRVTGVIGAEGILEQLSLALTYAMASERVLIIGAGAESSLFAAGDGCEVDSPLCFLQPPSSCRERDVADKLRAKSLVRSTERDAANAPVVLFDGGCSTDQPLACLANNPMFRASACLTCPGGRLWLEGQLMRYIFQPRDFIEEQIVAARASLTREWPIGAPALAVDMARSYECYTAAGQRSLSCPEAPILSKAMRTLAERAPLRGAFVVSESSFAIDSLRQHEQSNLGMRVFALGGVSRLCERPRAPVKDEPDFPLRAGCAARYYFGAGGRASPSLRQRFLEDTDFNVTQETIDRFIELGVVLQADHFVGVSTSLFTRVAIRLMYAYDQLHGDYGTTDWLLVDDQGNNWPWGNVPLYLHSLTNSAVASNRIMQHVVKAQTNGGGSLRVEQATTTSTMTTTPSSDENDDDNEEQPDAVDLFVRRQKEAVAAVEMQNRRIPSLAAKVVETSESQSGALANSLPTQTEDEDDSEVDSVDDGAIIESETERTTETSVVEEPTAETTWSAGDEDDDETEEIDTVSESSN
jgi:hypothetical protein